MDPVDRGVLLMHLANEAQICGGCGSYLDVSTGNEHVAQVHTRRCAGCEGLEVVQERHKDDKERGQRRWVDLIPVDEARKQGLIA